MMKRQAILVILDGWGVGRKDETNPIYIQGTPNIDYIKNYFLVGSLQASGISVGLPWNEEGNSEVGHLTIGAGKVLYQHFPRITMSIQDGSFAKNKVFLDAFEHVKNSGGALNIAGLLTEGNIHASFEHLVALIKLAKAYQVSKINLHIFSDGKDSDPKSCLKILKRLEAAADGGWRIGSISGRHFSLDRDNHWDRTEKAYQALIGNAPTANTVEEVIMKTYENNSNDQHVEPHVIDPDAAIKDNDALLFIDFREDSVRQITSSFVLKEFSEFPVKQFFNLYIGTMTSYMDKFNVPVAYPPEKVDNPLAKVLADNSKSQLHIAETEKYAHVTYFFNGLKEQQFPNEYRVLIPSRMVVSHDEKPEMQAAEITSRVIQAIEEKAFDFILVNYANGDMIAHTGNYEAARVAIKTVDDSLGALIRTALQNNAVLIITSDHGNAESMLNPRTGEATTTHDPNPVPIYIIGNEFVKQKSPGDIETSERETAGILSDVSPTILEILDIPKPLEMTGQSLLKILK
ncbi:MAG: 2,3-bisphosphoglycerate-independent phosphoglycerate mutase [Candidatus Harrisonbacteria bacterium]|nr:2,3-bisphosphoglycerate-independent phosphoglycerate mutase [Candidatus Harrisonbacteria bacterium]